MTLPISDVNNMNLLLFNFNCLVRDELLNSRLALKLNILLYVWRIM